MDRESTYRSELFFALAVGSTALLAFLLSDGGGPAYLLAAPPLLLSVLFGWEEKGASSITEILGGLIRLRGVRVRTLGTLFLLMPILIVTAVLFSVLLGEPVSQLQPAWEIRGHGTTLLRIAQVVATAFLFEWGWRSYGFGSLEEQYGPRRGAHLFALLFAMGQLPLLLLEGTVPYRLGVESGWLAVNYYVALVPKTFLVTRFWEENGRSLIAAGALHGVMKVFEGALALSGLTRLLETVLLFLVVAGLCYDRWNHGAPGNRKAVSSTDRRRRSRLC